MNIVDHPDMGIIWEWFHLKFSCFYCWGVVTVYTKFHVWSNRGHITPTLGSEGPQLVTIELICLCICLVACVTFWWSKRVDQNCAQHMRLQVTGSNPLGDSIIFPSVLPSGRPQPFCDFGICINYQCGSPVSRCIYPPVGYSQSYMSVSISVRLSALNFGDQSAHPVITCRVCGRRTWVQIPWVTV